MEAGGRAAAASPVRRHRRLGLNLLTEEVTEAVLGWGLPRLRDLPWRRTRDPWAILVSEVMLQQTQVARVAPRWTAFLGRYPTPAACAAAPLADVLRMWQGLGYPRRARDLHRCATAIAAGGRFPRRVDDLLALPGVGPYTARAVAAFAFEDDAAVVDTNIARLLARVAGRRLSITEAQRAADALLPRGRAWQWNQSVMDLGATVCRSRPLCDECPIAAHCAWRGRGPDPAAGSAGVSRPQSRFRGSDREARGKLLRAAAIGRIDLGSDGDRGRPIAEICGRDPADALRIASSLVDDGLLVAGDGWLALPADHT